MIVKLIKIKCVKQFNDGCDILLSMEGKSTRKLIVGPLLLLAYSKPRTHLKILEPTN